MYSIAPTTSISGSVNPQMPDTTNNVDVSFSVNGITTDSDISDISDGSDGSDIYSEYDYIPNSADSSAKSQNCDKADHQVTDDKTIMKYMIFFSVLFLFSSTM